MTYCKCGNRSGSILERTSSSGIDLEDLLLHMDRKYRFDVDCFGDMDDHGSRSAISLPACWFTKRGFGYQTGFSILKGVNGFYMVRHLDFWNINVNPSRSQKNVHKSCPGPNHIFEGVSLSFDSLMCLKMPCIVYLQLRES